jgi:hypothetical protein
VVFLAVAVAVRQAVVMAVFPAAAVILMAADRPMISELPIFP